MSMVKPLVLQGGKKKNIQSGDILDPSTIENPVSKNAGDSLYTANPGDYIKADTSTGSGGAFSVNAISSPSANDEFHVLDEQKIFGTNSLTISRNGSNIDSQADDLELDITGVEVKLRYIDSTIGYQYFVKDKTNF